MRRLLAATMLLAGLLSQAASKDRTSVNSRRPNVLLILADDLGYTDLGHYGSEINTPNLDALAREGISFSNFHTAANCAPARAMLMTGVNNHLAGVATIPEMVPPELGDYPAYQGVLSQNTVTIATLLQDAGYHTYLSGKWHLGSTPELIPFNRGFERTFMLADSGADNWEQRPYLPLYETANWYMDGLPTSLPEDFYSSRNLVDTLISFINSNRGDGQPFFAYLPLQAVHMPVQAPQEYIDRYMDAYTDGWNVLRENRRQAAIEAGLVPADVPMARMHTTEDWDTLTNDAKRYEAKRMAVYGGMVEAMDHNIGRLLQWLKDNGEFENTIIIFTSDNGAEASDMTIPGAALGMRITGHNIEYATLGLKRSLNTIGPSFASAAASPLSWYKFQVGEGGMRVPLIISGPGLEAQKGFNNAFTWIADLAPTILQMTGTEMPGERYGGKPVHGMEGKDLTGLLTGHADQVYGPNDFVAYELAGNKVVFHGDYKIVLHALPQGDGQWRLYDIIRDPGETADLASNHPALFQRMLGEWEMFEQRAGVQTLPPGYESRRQVTINALRKMLPKPILIFLLTLMILTPFAVAWKIRGKNNCA